MDYGNILQRAFAITFRHPALWLFGALAALFQSVGYVPNLIQFTIDRQDFSWLGPFISQLAQPTVIIALIAGFVALVILGFLVQLLSRAALIGMVGDIQGSGNSGVRDGFGHGFTRLPTLLGIYLVIWIPVALLVGVLIAIAFSPLLLLFTQESGTRIVGVALSVALFIMAFILIVVGIIALQLIQEFADRSCVLTRRGVFDSIGDGVGLVRRNLGHAVLTWLVLVGVNMVVGVVTVAIAAILALIVGVPAFLAASASPAAAIAVALALGIPAYAMFVFCISLGTVYSSSVWTLAYLRIRAIDEIGGTLP